MFDYNDAFSRNIGWVTENEQQVLRNKKVAIAGLGGVGGTHLITLTRLGIGRFSIADLDDFDIPNFNRQNGANLNTVGRTKLEVAKESILAINPEIQVDTYDQGVSLDNLDDFLSGADIYVDSLDVFALDIRRAVFKRCYELGIPTITAAPMGMGTAFLIFLPGKMSFEEYFDFQTETLDEQVIEFVSKVAPSALHISYLLDRSAVNIFKRKVPSTCMGIEISAGVACTQVLKILLGRGKIVSAPFGMHFDAYRNKVKKTWRPWGSKNPINQFMYRYVKGILEK